MMVARSSASENEKMFKDLRKVMIDDDDIRKSIKPIGLGEISTKGKITEEETIKKIFIVHGRDKTPALELARFLEKRYPIDAILLEEQAHRGITLIEKLEANSDVDFAFITLTPDDIGALKGEPLRERLLKENDIFHI
jgi:predicted nucleotide-binding protein